MTETARPVDDVALTLQSRLTEVLADGRQRSRTFSPQYEQLWESLERMAMGGKKIRPRLLIDAYEALGGIDSRAAIDAACAMQLLHIALVIHDDVIDNDTMRRGEMNIAGRFASEALLRGTPRPAATAWGEASSLLAGDLMLTQAQSLLARLDIDETRRHAILDIFDDTIFVSAAGEQSDVWLSLHLEEAEPDDVIAMVDRKTAAYSFRAPLSIAAVLAGCSTSFVHELSSIASQIGIIYQLRDDVLGLFGDETLTGKSVLSDLREGKETLLITFARSDPAWAQVASDFGNRNLDASDGQRLRRVIEESGARVFVESVIAQRVEALSRAIDEATFPSALNAQLMALSAACSSRQI